MFVKICGITNLDDALLAIKLGANALGFIFAPSKRRITLDMAKQIVTHLPPEVLKVGVFVNENKKEIIRIAEEVNLSYIQLHGNENPELCDELSESFRIIKAVKIDPDGRIKSKFDYSVWKILLDTYLPKVEGGSGKTFNWNILQNFDLNNIIVAGGITPGNIGILLSKYRPFGVDLSSGVEVSPGKKDPEKLYQFFEQISLIT